MLAPQTAVVLTVAERRTPTEAYVQWDSLSLEENRGLLSHYVVKLVNGCSIASESIEVTKNSIALTGLAIANTYCVAVASATKEGVGVFSKQKIIPCKLKLMQQH